MAPVRMVRWILSGEYVDRISIIISEPDHGMYEAINKGIRVATGEIIGLLHSDDFFL